VKSAFAVCNCLAIKPPPHAVGAGQNSAEEEGGAALKLDCREQTEKREGKRAGWLAAANISAAEVSERAQNCRLFPKLAAEMREGRGKKKVHTAALTKTKTTTTTRTCWLGRGLSFGIANEGGAAGRERRQALKKRDNWGGGALPRLALPRLASPFRRRK